MTFGSGSLWHLRARKDLASLLEPRAHTHTHTINSLCMDIELVYRGQLGLNTPPLALIGKVPPPPSSRPRAESSASEVFALIFDSGCRRSVQHVGATREPCVPKCFRWRWGHIMSKKKRKKSAYSTGVHIREGGVITRKFKIVGNCRVSKNKNHK